MWTPAITSFASHEWYRNTLSDGTTGLSQPAGLEFVRQVFHRAFGIAQNFVVLVVPDTRSMKDEKSLYNRHTQQIAFNTFMTFKEALTANELKGDNAVKLADDFKVMAIYPYKAEADMLAVQLDKIGDRIFSSITEAVSQGIGASVLILTIPNAQRLTSFVCDSNRFLVEITRHKLGLVVIVASDALKSDFYGFEYEVELIQHPVVGRFYWFIKMAESEKALVELLTPCLDVCSSCDRVGHHLTLCTPLCSLTWSTYPGIPRMIPSPLRYWQPPSWCS
ncbi:hypothetical protein ONS96_013395 [Cadophora gregata f. sp. sojae]|nr:hypothetical protein ONS96_013395 [Cadophora gregata f. sp. sojae]